MEIMWHGEVVAQFEIVSWHWVAGFQQYHEKPSFSVAVPCAHTFIRNFPITTQELLHSRLQNSVEIWDCLEKNVGVRFYLYEKQAFYWD